MELRHLRYFVAVAEELHFGRAAQRLLVSQPPLSQQIKDLEREVGTMLFVRTRRRVELTEAGRTFLKDAKDILLRVDLAAKSAQRAGQGHEGRVVIGYMAYASIHLLPRTLRAFQRQFPKVEVVLERMVSIDQARALREKRIDIGLVCTPFPQTGLEIEVVLREPLIVVMSKHHKFARLKRIPLNSLANESFIFSRRLSDAGYLGQVTKICRSVGVEMKVREAHDEDAILLMIAAGLGICLVPASARNIRHDGVLFRDLEDCPGDIELALAWRKQDESASVNNFVKTIRESKTSRH
jgi:DNA-binding transcriptional LysR family regulator